MFEHSAISTQTFELSKTVLFNVKFLDDEYSLKIELYRGTKETSLYRCLFWQIEMIEVGIYSAIGNKIVKDYASHSVQVDWSSYLDTDFDSFKAKTEAEALFLVESAIKRYISHTSGSDL